jgi:hypothetical protein
MTKPTSPQKQAQMELIRKKYLELKGKRNELKSAYLALVEQDLQRFKDDFADHIQAVYEDESLNVTIADLMNAMGTSSRNTVHDYLRDARKRQEEKFLSFTDNPFKGLSILDMVTVPNGTSGVIHRASVLDENTETIHIAQLSGLQNKYMAWTAHGEENPLDGDSWTPETKLSMKQVKRDGNYSETWLAFLDNNTEWLEFLDA